MKPIYTKMRSWITTVALTTAALSFAQQGTLSIDVKNITDADATVVITPSSDDLKYYWRVDTRAAFDANGGADKVVDNRIAIWKNTADYYDDGTTWQEMMSYDMVSGVISQNVSERFDPLTANTDYVVSAFAMDPQGNLTAPVTIYEFNNKKTETATLTIEIKNPANTDAEVVITPSAEDVRYYWGMMTKYKFDQCGGTEGIVNDRIEYWKKNAQYWDNTTWQEVMSWDLKSGVVDEKLSERFTIHPDNDYVVYAFGMNDKGEVTAPVATQNYSSVKAIPSNNTFTLSIKSISIDETNRANIKAVVTPTNSDRYAVRMYEKIYVEKYDLEGDKDAVKELINDRLLDASDSEIFSGEQTIQFNGRTADADCYLFVIGLDENKAPSTDLYILPFRTESTATEQTITLEVSDITPMNARFKITPSDENMYYYIDIAPTELVEQKGGIDIIPEQFIIDWWKFIADMYDDTKWQDLIPLQCQKGSLDTTVKELVEEGKLSNQYWDTDWTLYAVGFNESGEILTPTAVFNYTSPATEKSDLSFEMETVSMIPDATGKNYTAQIAVYPSRSGENFKAGYGTKTVYDAWVNNEDYGLNEYIKSQWMDNAYPFDDAVILEIPGLSVESWDGEPVYYKMIVMGWNEGPTTDPYIYDFSYEEGAGVSITPSKDVTVLGGEQKINIYGDCEKVAVYTMSGQLAGVLRGAGSIEVPSGVYLVRYSQDAKTYTTKVIVR